MTARSDATIEWFEGSRGELAKLFALANDSPAAVESYRDLGRILVARQHRTILGHLQLVDCPHAGELELKRLAVHEKRQGEGSEAASSGGPSRPAEMPAPPPCSSRLLPPTLAS
jgi:hypothetical protein